MSGWQPDYDPGQQPPQYQQQYPPQGYGPQQQGYYQPPQQQPPRKSHKGPLAFLGCGGLAALVILIAALASHSTSPSPATLPTVAVSQQAAPAGSTAAKAAKETVTYEVTGSPADVTYGPAGSSYSGTVPLSKTGPLGSPVYYAISAQLQGGGTVTCKIKVDGKVISQSTATGGYNIAQCEISRDLLTGAWSDTNGS
jgi:hypothetical protein